MTQGELRLGQMAGRSFSEVSQKKASLSRLVLSLHRARSARENFGNPLLETRIFVQGRAWTNMPGYGALGRRERVIMHKLCTNMGQLLCWEEYTKPYLDVMNPVVDSTSG